MYDLRAIIPRYMNSKAGFTTDFLASFPLELFVPAGAVDPSYSSLFKFPRFVCPQLLFWPLTTVYSSNLVGVHSTRLFRIMRVFKKAEKLRVTAYGLLLAYILGFAYVAHMMGCAFYFICYKMVPESTYVVRLFCLSLCLPVSTNITLLLQVRHRRQALAYQAEPV